VLVVQALGGRIRDEGFSASIEVVVVVIVADITCIRGLIGKGNGHRRFVFFLEHEEQLPDLVRALAGKLASRLSGRQGSGEVRRCGRFVDR
jgi:hypothetical protein